MKLLDEFLKYQKVSTDTRKIEPNTIFFALKGPNFDGNKYAAEAIAKGAALAIIDNPNYKGPNTLLVDDTLKALQILAKDYRKHLGLEVIGLTGSNGKTTTKELLLKALSTSYRTQATQGNFNNHIGVPLTLLSLKKDTEIAIIEMGDNKPGDIAELCEIAEPNIGIITNIGKDHIEGYGSIEGNLETKLELFEYLNKNGGTSFYPTGDKLLNNSSTRFVDIISIESISNSFNYEIKDSNPYARFSLNQGTYETKLVGNYNHQNIQFALAISNHYKVETKKAAKAITTFTPQNNRSQFIETKNNQLILDAYNANPSSVDLAIESFKNMATDLPKIAILGDMLELGNISIDEHEAMIKKISSIISIEPIFVGEIYSSLKKNSPRNFFNSTEEVKIYLEKKPIKKALVLLKGSRGIKLESLVEHL